MERGLRCRHLLYLFWRSKKTNKKETFFGGAPGFVEVFSHKTLSSLCLPERPWSTKVLKFNLRQRERKKLKKNKKKIKTSHRRRDNAPTGYQSPESHFMLCKRCHGCSDDRINLKLLLLKDSTKSSQFWESTDP